VLAHGSATGVCKMTACSGLGGNTCGCTQQTAAQSEPHAYIIPTAVVTCYRTRMQQHAACREAPAQQRSVHMWAGQAVVHARSRVLHPWSLGCSTGNRALLFSSNRAPGDKLALHYVPCSAATSRRGEEETSCSHESWPRHHGPGLAGGASKRMQTQQNTASGRVVDVDVVALPARNRWPSQAWRIRAALHAQKQRAPQRMCRTPLYLCPLAVGALARNIRPAGLVSGVETAGTHPTMTPARCCRQCMDLTSIARAAVAAAAGAVQQLARSATTPTQCRFMPPQCPCMFSRAVHKFVPTSSCPHGGRPTKSMHSCWWAQ
jgi:hypothetical protein